jgi:hypothetical protein
MRTYNSYSISISVHVRALYTVICYLALQGSTRRPSTAQCPTHPHTSSPVGVRWQKLVEKFISNHIILYDMVDMM